MDKNTFMAKAAEFARIRDEYHQMVVDNGKSIFSELAQDVFDKNPKLINFQWNQYTPYFNDGDECIFGVNRDYFNINTDSSESYFDLWYLESEKYRQDIKYNEYGFDTLDELIQAVKDIKELMNVFSDEDFKDIFGDHAQVTISNNGEIEVDGYDHD